MDRELYECTVRRRFGDAPAAISSAISEIRLCMEVPEYLAAVRGEMGPELPVEQVVLEWALRRGSIWRDPWPGRSRGTREILSQHQAEIN